MKEFEFINSILSKLSGEDSIGLLDDVAYLKGNNIVFSTDTLCQDVHFLKKTSPYLLAKKLLLVNISDVIAKGAKPVSYSLNLAFGKEVNNNWLLEFARGLTDIGKEYQIKLLGGDTVKLSSGIVISATIYAQYKNKIILRSEAKEGDDIWVTGNIGDGYLGLLAAKGDIDNSYLKNCYLLPQIKYEMLQYMEEIANSSIDVSDGLLQDLGHIIKLSQKGAEINIDKVPISNQAEQILQKGYIKKTELLSAGDDYQILFTSNQENYNKIRSIEQKSNIKITKIGKVNRKKEIILLDGEKRVEILNGGYQHQF